MLFNLPETSLCITDMFVVTNPLKDSQERKCNEQHWETNRGKEVERGHYSVKLPCRFNNLQAAPLCSLTHICTWPNCFSTFQATGLCIIVIKNETFKVAMQLKYTVLGVRRHAVSHVVGVLRHPDVRVDSHDPLHRRRPLSTCRLPSVAEWLCGEDPDRRQRDGIDDTRLPDGRRQLSSRAGRLWFGYSSSLLSRAVAGRGVETRLRAAHVRWSVRSSSRRLRVALLPHLPSPQTSSPTPQSHHQQTTVCHIHLYYQKAQNLYPFDAHCWHTGTPIKHPVPDRVKPSFVIFDIRALWRSAMSVRVPGCQKLQTTT